MPWKWDGLHNWWCHTLDMRIMTLWNHTLLSLTRPGRRWWKPTFDVMDKKNWKGGWQLLFSFSLLFYWPGMRKQVKKEETNLASTPNKCVNDLFSNYSPSLRNTRSSYIPGCRSTLDKCTFVRDTINPTTQATGCWYVSCKHFDVIKTCTTREHRRITLSC